MSGRRKRPEYLNRTDHRLDMSPAGRNLFVSRDKQLQERAARRLRLGMRVVIALVILCAAVAAGIVAGYYLVPWFRDELTVSDSVDQVESKEPSVITAEEYDGMGLPVYEDEVCLFVVNPQNPVGAWYVPVLAEEGGVKVDERILPALRMMVNAARKDGLSLKFTEGYVSYEEQKKRFDATVKELIEEKGLSTVMADTEAKERQPSPGESDFQSGMCLRLDGNPETFASSKTCSWLKNNMGKYGFVFRYPEYKSDSTGVEADMTVIRYVGGRAAAAMQQLSMCMEEYLDYLDMQ